MLNNADDKLLVISYIYNRFIWREWNDIGYIIFEYISKQTNAVGCIFKVKYVAEFQSLRYSSEKQLSKHDTTSDKTGQTWYDLTLNITSSSFFITPQLKPNVKHLDSNHQFNLY